MTCAGVYGPSVTDLDYVIKYQDAMQAETSEALYAILRNCLANGSNPAAAGPGCTMRKMGEDADGKKIVETNGYNPGCTCPDVKGAATGYKLGE